MTCFKERDPRIMRYDEIIRQCDKIIRRDNLIDIHALLMKDKVKAFQDEGIELKKELKKPKKGILARLYSLLFK